MPKQKFTKTAIDSWRKPGNGTKLYWDTTTKGFGLRVTNSGAASFVVQCQIKGQDDYARITIGTYGAWTIDQAREAADKYRHQMEKGIDPRKAKKTAEAEQVTLGEVMEAYLARPGQLKDATAAEYRRNIERTLASWKDKPLASITTEMVKDRHAEITRSGSNGNRAAPHAANAAMVTLRILYNFAQDEYLVDGKPIFVSNPVRALKRHWTKQRPRTREVDEKLVGEAWNALTTAYEQARDADARAGVDLVRFLFLTGSRRNEGAKLTWDRVDLDEGWFHLPDPKNNNAVWIPLSTQAVELLKARQPSDNDKDASPFVFPSRSKAGHVQDTRAPLERISKVVGEHLSAHDLRRTFVSLGVATLGIDLHKLELLTNHVPKGVTARHYLRTSKLQYLQPEVQEIGNWIEHEGKVALAKAQGDNVVSLPQRA